MAKISKDVEAMAGLEIDNGLLSQLALLAVQECVSKDAVSTWNRNGGPQKAALYDSLAHLVGRRFPADVLKANLQRVVANWNLIMQGVAIPVWQGEQITSDVLFVSMLRENKDGRRVYHVKTKLRTGLAAGITLVFNLYDGSICRFLDKEAGTSKYNCAPEELSGMRARITHSRIGNRDRIDVWNATAKQKAHNKKLTEARADMTKCTKLIPCEMCNATVRTCPLAIWSEEENGK